MIVQRRGFANYLRENSGVKDHSTSSEIIVWFAVCAGDSSPRVLRYKPIVERFAEFLGEAKNQRDLSTLQASEIARFRDQEAKERSRATANLSLKVPRVCLGEAVRQGLLAVNPAVRVKLLNQLRNRSGVHSPSQKSGES